MVASTAAMPVTPDAQAVDVNGSAPDANINYNLQPLCPDPQTSSICLALNKHPYCRGTKFISDLGDQCSACWCE